MNNQENELIPQAGSGSPTVSANAPPAITSAINLTMHPVTAIVPTTTPPTLPLDPDVSGNQQPTQTTSESMSQQYESLLRRAALLMESNVDDDNDCLQIRYDCLKGLKNEIMNFGFRTLFADQEVYAKAQQLQGLLMSLIVSLGSELGVNSARAARAVTTLTDDKISRAVAAAV